MSGDVIRRLEAELGRVLEATDGDHLRATEAVAHMLLVDMAQQPKQSIPWDMDALNRYARSIGLELEAGHDGSHRGRSEAGAGHHRSNHRRRAGG